MTQTLIQTVTVGAGGAATVSFSSIPQTYTDLLLVLSLRTSDTGTSWTATNFTINGVTTNQSDRFLYGNGATTTSSTGIVVETWVNSGNSTANTFANSSIYIPNYTGSANKIFWQDTVSENNSTTALSIIATGAWSSTANITSLSCAPISGTFVQYSTAYLYGVN